MPSFTVIDALDILLVAFFLFRLMMLIRGTRATAIIKGLAVLFVANLASGLLGLRTVNWILEQGTTVILVALPVVFYPELRRALEHLGRGQLFSRFSGMGQEEIARIVDPIARSARLLAESHTGALIVIERDVGLEEYVESGVRMDALLTTELLLTSSLPTPRCTTGPSSCEATGWRLRGASCLSRTTRTSAPRWAPATGRASGSRSSPTPWRSIVSEETGSISLAKAGRIERNLDEDTLRMRLARELQGTLGLGRRGGLG